jgi:hypothetical protein
MRISAQTVNPFVMMMEPQAIIDAVHASGELRSLRRKVWRPLDKPLIPKALAAELAEFDAAIDTAEETDTN